MTVPLLSQDTIVACSTPTGRGAIAIIRMSGPESLSILSKVFKNPKEKPVSEIKSNTLTYGWIQHPETNETLDEVMVGFMAEPNTFTGEDVVEINCHGGMVVPASIISLLLKIGARQAGPGEFTLRALRSGRIDLSQAQAISSLIDSQTESAARLALQQLRGGLSKVLEALREDLKESIILVETDLEFPLDETDVDALVDLPPLVKNCLERTKTIKEGLQRSKVVRDGILTLIVGRPNVGKSSLFNRLARRNRVIVSEHPGTTRDCVEETISLGGLPFKVVDTAGLGVPQDAVDALGMGKTREYYSSAELLLAVVTAKETPSEKDRELLNELLEIPDLKDRVVLVLNKIDLYEGPLEHWEKEFNLPIYPISTLTGEGMDNFEKNIIQSVEEVWQQGETADWISLSESQTLALGYMETELKSALEIFHQKGETDKLSFHLKEAWESLDKVDGKSLQIDLLEEIFSRFCIGK